MDYETKATNRQALRLYARLFRVLCGFSQSEPIDPVMLLDRLPDLPCFRDVGYVILDDKELPANVPAQCIKNDDGYLIQIKDSVFSGAYKNKTGGYRMHIMHEIVHVFADKLGFEPIDSSQFKKDIRNIRSYLHRIFPHMPIWICGGSLKASPKTAG